MLNVNVKHNKDIKLNSILRILGTFISNQPEKKGVQFFNDTQKSNDLLSFWRIMTTKMHHIIHLRDILQIVQTIMLLLITRFTVPHTKKKPIRSFTAKESLLKKQRELREIERTVKL